MRTVLTTEAFDACSRTCATARDGRASTGPQPGTSATAHLSARACPKIDLGPGYRVYFVQRGLELIILLAGGDKSTQVKDIALAKELARQL